MDHTYDNVRYSHITAHIFYVIIHRTRQGKCLSIKLKVVSYLSMLACVMNAQKNVSSHAQKKFSMRRFF